ncbi:zinc finger and BTB domain-containing protein 17-like [Temnothorax curvispinosus]|uniref:Zinc finger and BTB domain-containing protein 17-like n=1 Tax=Temnothorax curvispinosus TaxID=300111 RepID=A0A6J1QIE0_9HYME|nr:zinc finger and BTB domain-containing protein 17-like [Temnothorax curvispinosus]
MYQGCIHSIEKLQYELKSYGCDLRVSNPIQLDDHVFANHAEVTALKFCHCSRIFADEKSLKNHIQVKHKLQYCRCSFCSTPYENFRRLKTLSKQYMCPYCHKCFYRWKDLSVHMSIHEKLMRCKICGKKFSTKWLMRQHLIDKHSEKECDWSPSHCSTDIRNQGAANKLQNQIH